MADVLFIVQRREDATGRWAYIDSCPHGQDMGAIRLGPVPLDARTAEERATLTGVSSLTWQWTDLGNGRCRISPSILAKGVHGGQDCHFGPGEFDFLWLEEGEYRNAEPFLSRYRARTGKVV